ncbi:unnamed protein product [Paramecium primaurelia]|uniref:Cyclin-like domain-containing protein n=1 Tax=Paramecium primaurelia TaxID=5886 RepID=A0A8S1QGU5_PARPR|nr:unnamed protein product [Paramecium primaurelia]
MEYIQKMIRPFTDRSNYYVQQPNSFKRKESKHTHDPQSVLLYIKQIFFTLQTQQNVNMSFLNPNYFSDIQSDLNPEMRAQMIDEVHKLCTAHKAQRRTFHQTIYLLDVYLSTNRIFTAQIDSIYKTCYFIASKYEEIYPSPLWRYTYDRDEMQEIFQIEKELLSLLDFKLVTASSYVWLNYYWTIITIAEKTQNWLTYSLLLLDVAVYNINIIKYEPSKIACASLYTSAIMLNIQMNWNSFASQFGLHFQHEIKEISNLIMITLKDSVNQKREIVKHMQLQKDREFY